MTHRLLAALLWLAVVLVPPLRGAAHAVAAFLVPTERGFRLLALAPDIPFVLLVSIGFALTCWGLRALLAHQPELSALLDPGGGPRLRAIAWLLTGSWLAAAAWLGTLDLPLVLAAAIALVPFAGRQPPPRRLAAEPELLPLPQPPPLPAPEPSPPEPGGESLRRQFSWLFAVEPYRRASPTHRFELELAIPKALYDELRARDHRVAAGADYVRFANEQLADCRVNQLAGHLRALADRHGFDALAEIHLAMAFTLSMQYVPDAAEHGGEYPKYPVEMLVDQRGDCEDFAILCGAVLHRLGHKVALLLLGFADRDGGHAALGVASPVPLAGHAIYSRQLGAELFYCEVTPPPDASTRETTAAQWWLGMDPPAGVAAIEQHPIGGA